MKTATYYIRAGIFSLLLITSFTLAGQIRVDKIPDTTKAGNGVVFCLPQTRVLVQVIVEKLIYEKGGLSEFTEEFLGSSDIIAENKTVYKIKDIVISTQAEPDVSQYYVITQKSSLFGFRKSARVNLTRDGLLHSINWTNAECTYEQVMPSVRAFNWDHMAPRMENPSYFTYHLNTNILSPQKINLPITDTNLTISESQHSGAEPQKEMSSRDKAKESAQELARIRDAKEKLLSGFQEISYERGTLKLMTDQLHQMEEHLLRQFKGSMKSEILQFEYSCIPKLQDPDPIEIFRFSSSIGVSDINSGNGDIIALGFTKGKAGMPAEQEIKGKKKGFGIPFRLPNTAECIIYNGNAEVFRSRITIAQFGEAARLPEKVKRVLFYPETGGIKSLLKE